MTGEQAANVRNGLERHARGERLSDNARFFLTAMSFEWPNEFRRIEEKVKRAYGQTESPKRK